MKVLIVHPKLDIYGGAELVVEKLARHLTGRGIENAVLTTALTDQVRASLEGVRVLVYRKSLPLAAGGLSEIVSLWKETRRLGREYDIVNVHNFPAELASFLLPVPVIWMCNEPPCVHLAPHLRVDSLSELKKRLLLLIEKLVVRRGVRHVVVADEFNASRFMKLYDIEPRIIPYGIDYDFFSCGDGAKAVKELGLEGHFVIVHTGTLTPLKNQIESLKTIVQLRDSIPAIKLVLAGQELGDYKRTLDSYIVEHGLEKNVVFTGHVSRETIRNLYKGCHLLLHPVNSQGGWLTPFEALCAGLPVVVSKELTAADIIRHEEIGQVTDNFAGAVSYVYEHQQECRAAAEKGARWIKESLSWETFGDCMIQYFEEILTRRNR